MLNRFAFTLWLLFSSVAFGQVDIATITTITCRTPVPAGGSVEYDWYGDKGLTLTPSDRIGRSVVPSGAAGTYDGVVVATIDGVKTPTAFSVTIGDSPQPPEPEISLRDLVKDETEANQVASFLRAFVDELPSLKTPEDFWLLFDAAFPAQDNAQLIAALKTRISAAMANRPKELSKELLAIADEIAKLDPKPPEPPEPEPPATEATAVTYVYEKDEAVVPAEVLAAINRLNRERGIVATVFEEDTTDADGNVPEQYKVPLAAAKKVGLPALVATKEDEVLKVIKDPRTEAQVWSIAP